MLIPPLQLGDHLDDGVDLPERLVFLVAVWESHEFDVARQVFQLNDGHGPVRLGRNLSYPGNHPHDLNFLARRPLFQLHDLGCRRRPTRAEILREGMVAQVEAD